MGDTMQFSSIIVVDGGFSHNTLPSETFCLFIRRLDASSFRVEVAKAATVAELKKAVEAVFSHVPQKGPGKILWPHVWGQFCLCYQEQNLVTETDCLRKYGIKDGDQLHFVRHVSNICSFQKKLLKKGVSNRRSSSKVNRYQQKEVGKDDDFDLDDIVIDNGMILQCNTEENWEGKSRLTGFLGGLLSYTQLTAVRRAIINNKICSSLIARGIVSSFRKIRRILSFCKRQHYSRGHTWREYR